MEVGIILIHYLIHEVQYHVVNMGGNRNNQRDNLCGFYAGRESIQTGIFYKESTNAVL